MRPGRWYGAAALTFACLVPPASSAQQPEDLRFRPHELYSIGSDVTAVAIGDVMGGDGADLVVTTGFRFDPANDYALFVLAQQPDGRLGDPEQFATTQSFKAGSGYANDMGVDTGDIDADGDADIALAHHEGIDLYRQGRRKLVGPRELSVVAADGTRLSSDVLGIPLQVVIEDMNQDGRPDLLVNARGAGVIVLVRARRGYRVVPVLPGNTVDDIEVLDANGDDLPDVLARDDWQVNINLATPSGEFIREILFVDGDGQQGADAADVNGDGRTDIIAPFESDEDVPAALHVLEQRRSGFSDEARRVYPAPYFGGPIEAGLIDGDTRADAVVAHKLGIGAYYRQAGGRLLAPEPFAVPEYDGYPAKGLTVGDLNGDGWPDIASVAFAGVGVATQRPSVARTVSLRYAAAENSLRGRVGSAEADCTAGVGVTLAGSRQDQRWSEHRFSDSDGRFSLDEPPPGRYRASVATERPMGSELVCNAARSDKTVVDP